MSKHLLLFTVVLGLSSVAARAARDRIDVLVVVDNHGQKPLVQERLAQNFEAFFKPIQALDYHLAVVAADQNAEAAHWDSQNPQSAYYGFPNKGASTLLSREGNERYLDKSAGAQVFDLFFQNLDFGMQSDSRPMGLESGFQAVQKRMFGDSAWNHGFIRSDAFLSIVVVSDEDEHLSSDSDQLLRANNTAFHERIEKMVDYLSDLKPCGCAPPRFDAIVKASAQGACGETLSEASEGVTYREAARRLGGKALDLCDAKLSESMGLLGAEIAKAAHEAH